MYALRLKLPASLPDALITHLGQRTEEQTGAQPETQILSFSAMRNGTHRGDWTLEWLFEATPEAEASANPFQSIVSRIWDEITAAAPEYSALPTLRAQDWSGETLPETDWLAQSYAALPPFSIGDFFVYGSHYSGAVPEDALGLHINAATAFGSGTHGTTAGCLRALLHLRDQGVCPWNILDMGTGSGILGIAAWKLWKAPVCAIDNDAEATRMAALHRDINHVPDGAAGMTCATGDGFAADMVQHKKPYDLVIANILASVLKTMVQDIKAVTDDNGYVLLSGILTEQEQTVLDVYTPIGFVLRARFEIEGWVSLLLQQA